MSFLRRWFYGLECQASTRIDGKTVIITGANTGIGLETARELVSRGGRVILACRDEKRAQEAADDITSSLRDASGVGTVVVKHLDLASLESVREFSRDIIETEPRVDILVNNAGVMLCPLWKTKDGFEMQFGVNYLGHFLLTNLLLDRLKASAPSRIVNVSSMSHSYGKINFDDINSEKGYNSGDAYTQSMLARMLFTFELAKRLRGSGVTVYALHPGVVKSNLWRYSDQVVMSVIPWLVNKVGDYLMRNVVEGAQTTIYCAVAEDVENQSGLYYRDCAIKQPSPKALDGESAKRLWELSCRLTGLDDCVNGAESEE